MIKDFNEAEKNLIKNFDKSAIYQVFKKIVKNNDKKLLEMFKKNSSFESNLLTEKYNLMGLENFLKKISEIKQEIKNDESSNEE